MAITDTILTAAVTISGGIAIFGITQLLQRFWLEPIHEQAKAVGAAGYALFYYGKCYANPGALDSKIQEESSWALRKVAGDLAATANGVRLYRLCRLLRLTPDRDCVSKAIGRITGISNSMFQGDGMENSRWADEAYAALGIRRYGK